MDVVAEGIVVDYDEPFERHVPVGFRPCQHFEGDDCHRVAHELTTALAEMCETDTRARGSLLICLDELAENVIHHSESPVGGFAAAQGWPRKRNEMEVAIVDLGRFAEASRTTLHMPRLRTTWSPSEPPFSRTSPLRQSETQGLVCR
jgi:hypothetical protein